MAEVKSKFQNRGAGVVGVVVIGLDEKPEGIPVAPQAFVWLSEHEQVLTANAPANDSDNPFENGSLVLITRGSEANSARKIGEDQDPESPVTTPPEDPAAAGDPALAEEEIEEVQPPAAEPPPPPDAGEELGAGDPVEGDPPSGQRAQNEEVAEAPPEPEPAAEPVAPPAKPAPAAKAPPPKPVE